MEEKKYKKTVEEAFNEAAAGYDHPILRFFDNSAEILARSIPLKGNEGVLDAATGTGKVAMAVARRLKNGEVTGIDFSNGMLSLAAKKAREAGLKNISFTQCDVDAADFPAEKFDGLTCNFGVHFWQDMGKSLSRLLGAIKTGGFVGISSFAKGAFEPHSDLCLKRFASYGVKLPESYSLERLDHPDKMEGLFKAADLKNIVLSRAQAGYDLERPEDWWDLVRFSGYRAFLNQLTAEQAARYKDEFISEVRDSAKGKKIFLNVEIITAIAVK